VAAVGSSVVAMFPLFITHDEYFVRCGGSGGGYYNVFDMSSYKLLSRWWQCDSSAMAAARQWRVVWRQCWQRGGSGGRAVAAQQRQRSDGSLVVVIVGRQHGSGQRGGSVGQCGSSAAAARRRATWWQCQQRGGGHAGSTLAAAGLVAAAKVWRSCSISRGSRVAGAALPPRTATVVTKTPAATVMAETLPTINNQLKAAAAIVMETTTTTTNKT
jgi:hypothetical protein